MNEHVIIAIDGPAGSGKSTVARRLAREMGLLYIDTGAMYRAITYAVLFYKIDPSDENAVSGLLSRIDLEIGKNAEGRIEIRFLGKTLENELRNLDVDKHVSLVSSYGKVREFMVERQRQLSGDFSVVLDGRDIGTVVFPRTPYKFFLDASVDERARRRFLDKKAEKGLSLEEIKTEIIRRDQFDRNRKISPLRQAADAVYLDTTSMDIDEVVLRLRQRIRELA